MEWSSRLINTGCTRLFCQQSGIKQRPSVHNEIRHWVDNGAEWFSMRPDYYLQYVYITLWQRTVMYETWFGDIPWNYSSIPKLQLSWSDRLYLETKWGQDLNWNCVAIDFWISTNLFPIKFDATRLNRTKKNWITHQQFPLVVNHINPGILYI